MSVGLRSSHDTRLTITTIYSRLIIEVIGNGDDRLKLKMIENNLETLNLRRVMFINSLN